MTIVKGSLSRQIYYSSTGFLIGVIRLSEDVFLGEENGDERWLKAGDNLTVKGSVANPKLGKEYTFQGYFVADPKYGIQLHVSKQVFTGSEHDFENVVDMMTSLLQERLSRGDTYVPKDDMLLYMRQQYDINRETFEMALDSNCFRDSDVIIENFRGYERFYLYSMAEAEESVAEDIGRLNVDVDEHSQVDLDFKLLEDQMGIVLSDDQRDAILGSLNYGISVITGGPGTGKTTIIRGITKVLRDLGYFVALAAPTGRAAKRIKESTGYTGYTIHRLLEATLDEKRKIVRFNRNRENPLEQNAIIIDEASMIDVELMMRLLEACDDETRLVFVGDYDQLAPVGPGSVLQDIIESECIHTVKLSRIFRQAELSKIVMTAHRINQGEEPDLTYSEGDDLLFLDIKTAEEVVNRIVDLAKAEDTQVITPSKRGRLGTGALNKSLQEALNPPEDWKQEVVFESGELLREGDRVMQIKNNYGKEWVTAGSAIEGKGLFNGDMGVVVSIDPVESRVAVKFDEEKIASYTLEELQEIQLSYAITVHKSQGSEFSTVIMPVSRVGRLLGNRNLIYTAITRGKDNVVLLGSKTTFVDMIHNVQGGKRRSGLSDRLKELMNIN